MNTRSVDERARRIQRELGRRRWPGHVGYFVWWGVWIVVLLARGAWYFAIPLAAIVVFFHRYQSFRPSK